MDAVGMLKFLAVLLFYTCGAAAIVFSVYGLVMQDDQFETLVVVLVVVLFAGLILKQFAVIE